ncbi:YebC/PmpR family DNA-binding transcriptional regulator [Gallaecimonas mangrovi]|uniref:YebC/PmpR family DNA-binding transcriptional regulator n=1 Tax=Gallaecimonas mangrovi TaxID=2291597 RepID=UPI000E203140|nr:YebC/PmpR family DNA-binding transcriptional regulator [Gallaecimonas mangrovi]
MAGHSKEANIKHQSAAQDGKRGKAFTTLVGEMATAARQHSDIDTNLRLRAAVGSRLGVFGPVKDALDEQGFDACPAQVTMVPDTKAELALDQAKDLMDMIDLVEDLDGVQKRYANACISKNLVEQRL